MVPSTCFGLQTCIRQDDCRIQLYCPDRREQHRSCYHLGFLWATQKVEKLYTDFVRGLRENSPLSDVVHGCPSECKATIRAPALVPKICTTTETSVNYTATGWHYGSEHIFLAAPLESQDFMISIGLIEQEEQEGIWLVTGYFNGTDCIGIMHQTACTLRSGIGEYAVTIRDGVVSFDDPGHPQIVAFANNTAVDHGNYTGNGGGKGFHPSTLSMIALTAWSDWDSSDARLAKVPTGPSAVQIGAAVAAYMIPNDTYCNSFRNPRPDVVASMNMIMIRAGRLRSQRREVTSEPGWKRTWTRETR